MISHYGRLEKKKAEEELATHKLMVESLSSGVFAFDLKGDFTSVNNVVVGYRYKKELLGKNLREFLPEKIRVTDREHWIDLTKGKICARRN